MHSTRVEVTADPWEARSPIRLLENLQTIDLAPSESKPMPVTDTTLDPVVSPLEGATDSTVAGRL